MSISPAALGLTSLAIEYCKAVAAAETTPSRQFLREVLRYLPRIYITVADIKPYGEDSEGDETGLIYDTVTEDQYEAARAQMAAILGADDMFLDTPVDDMQYSDTPVAVSLAELLADIYQAMADFAATMAQIQPDMVPDALSELKYRFASYLADIICRALKAANYIYFNATFDDDNR